MRGIEWLKSQCNRYKNGHCSTLKCLNAEGLNGAVSNLKVKIIVLWQHEDIDILIENLEEMIEK